MWTTHLADNFNIYFCRRKESAKVYPFIIGPNEAIIPSFIIGPNEAIIPFFSQSFGFSRSHMGKTLTRPPPGKRSIHGFQLF